MNHKTSSLHSTRKRTTLLISLFSILALAGTGFASFIISEKQTTDLEGNIEIGEVDDETTTFYDVALSHNTISFNPSKNDKSGRVRSDGSDDEVLSTTLTFDFDYAKNLSSITVQLDLTQGIKDAISQNYITLTDQQDLENGKVFQVDGPTYSSLDTSHIGNSKRSGLTDGKGFTYTIEFGWGSLFHYKNPDEYYDNDDQGKLVSDDDMITTLNSLHSLLSPGDATTESQKMKVNISAQIN